MRSVFYCIMEQKEKRKGSRSSSDSDTPEFDKSDASSDKSSMGLPEPRQFVPPAPSPLRLQDKEREFASSFDFDAQSIDFRRLFSTGTEVANPVRARVRGTKHLNRLEIFISSRYAGNDYILQHFSVNHEKIYAYSKNFKTRKSGDSRFLCRGT